MTDILKQVLGELSGGRVLDVATGEGGFVWILADQLMGYAQIVGIDDDAAAVEEARDRLDRDRKAFVQMDAGSSGFRSRCFDTVTISASLHHLADVPGVVAEVRRVLKPGGRFVLAEMHRNGQTAAQRTMIAMHHWVADVSTALGMFHSQTLARGRVVDIARSVGLCNVVCYDSAVPDSNPMDETTLRDLVGVIDRTLQQVNEVENPERLWRRGEELRERLYKTGAQPEPVVVIVGTKE